MYRVIRTDNYNRSFEQPYFYGEFFITVPLSKSYCEQICEALNNDPTRHESDYYKTVPEDYCLERVS